MKNKTATCNKVLLVAGLFTKLNNNERDGKTIRVYQIY